MGVDLPFLLYDACETDLRCIVDAYKRKERNKWLRARRIAYASVSAMGSPSVDEEGFFSVPFETDKLFGESDPPKKEKVAKKASSEWLQTITNK